jgi:hypothetical protein
MTKEEPNAAKKHIGGHVGLPSGCAINNRVWMLNPPGFQQRRKMVIR